MSAAKNLTIARATRILTEAALLPSARIVVKDSKSGLWKYNRIAMIEVSAGDDAEAITASIDAALAAAGFTAGWWHMASGIKQTGYTTAIAA